MNQKKIKRFYKSAGVSEGADDFAVVLDGRPVRTPAASPLRLPTSALAEAVAAEWQEQGEHVEPASMPLTQLASTAIDRVPPHRAAVIEELLQFAATDLLCYRATEPQELAELQVRTWQPLLDWAMMRYDAPLRVTAGVMPVPQPDGALAALHRAVSALDDWRLTALQSATAALGSLVLALAMLERRVDAGEATAASQLDELYQIRLWGDDPEAAARREKLGHDIAAAARFAGFLGG